MSAQDNVQIINDTFDLWNKRDSSKYETFISPNFECVIEATGENLHGVAGWGQFWDQWQTAFPDNKVSIISMIADDKGVALEGTFQGTHTGVLKTPNGDIPPTGRTVNKPFSGFYGFQGGKISKYHIYFDILSILQELGVVPEMAQTTA